MGCHLVSIPGLVNKPSTACCSYKRRVEPKLETLETQDTGGWWKQQRQHGAKDIVTTFAVIGNSS